MTDQSKIINRIKALIAKANSSEHEAEAMAFMAKANQLLTEHQLDANLLDENDDPVKAGVQAYEMTNKDPSWIKHLFSSLGVYYGCRIVYSPKFVRGQWGFAIELTGRESAIVTTELMFPWIKAQCYAAGRRLAKEFPGMSAQQHARRVGNALYHRIYRLYAIEQAKNQVAPKTDAAAQNALVTVDRVKALFDETYGDIKSARSGRSSTHAAARDEANKIGIHRQMDGGTTLKLGSK